MEHLEDDLLCPVCYSLFEDPRSLPCAHTFCRPCLEAIFEQAGAGGGGRVKRRAGAAPRCPACQRPVEAEEARLVPANYALAAVLETFRRGRRPLWHEHTCHEHPSQAASMFCSRERLLVCVRCIAPGGLHAGHLFDSPERAAVREWGQLEALVARLDGADKWADVRRRLSLQERRRMETEERLSAQERSVQRELQRLSSSLRAASLRAQAAHASLRASADSAMAEASTAARELLARRERALTVHREFTAAHAERDAGAAARFSFLRDVGPHRRELEALCNEAPPRVLALAPARHTLADGRRFRLWAAAVDTLLARAPVVPSSRARVAEEEGPYCGGATLGRGRAVVAGVALAALGAAAVALALAAAGAGRHGGRCRCTACVALWACVCACACGVLCVLAAWVWLRQELLRLGGNAAFAPFCLGSGARQALATAIVGAAAETRAIAAEFGAGVLAALKRQSRDALNHTEQE